MQVSPLTCKLTTAPRCSPQHRGFFILPRHGGIDYRKKSKMKQTILGASGIVGTELAKALSNYTNEIRIVSRNPKRVNTGDELCSANLLDAEQTIKAVAGSEIAYLTVGLQYSITVWQAQWHIVMKNVIDACKLHNTKLVFFDNVYALGKVNGPMTEETPMNPCSKKGEVRAKIGKMILDEVRSGKLTALIARAPDFYGPNTPLSLPEQLVFRNLREGKTPRWLINADVKHSFIYTPDAGKAAAILGNSPDAFNQIWNLPVDTNHLTGREFVALAAEAAGRNKKVMVLPKFMVKAVGFFVPAIKESVEMLYQYDREYIFDCSKFNRTFKFEAAPYAEGIKASA